VRKLTGTSLAAIGICLLAACGRPAEAPRETDRPAARPQFVPGASFEQVQRQHRRLPADDIWWTVNGPDMAWNNKNLHQLFPTVNVYRAGRVSELGRRPLAAIADYPVATPDGEMTFDAFIHSEQSTLLGIVILHRGDIVYERYPRMQDYEMPVYWSVAKAFVGTVVRILEERGQIDVSQPIESYVPELAESSFAGITIRNILDMATGLDCADEYVDRDACYYRYSMAIGDGFRTAAAPDNPYDFAATLEAERLVEQGTQFSYSGLNTFVLAWLVEKVTGMPFQDAFTREVWFHIGAESNASYIAPRYGVAVTHGGFLARLRDVARFGLLFTPSWRVVSETPIISDAHLRLLLDEGRPELLANAGAGPAGVRHNVYQWDQVMTNGDIYKGGWAGQGLLINPRRDLVAVFTGYFKDDDYSEIEAEPVIRGMLDDIFGE
jgi:CubicO group peptidase (beta-lactamase class C family)